MPKHRLLIIVGLLISAVFIVLAFSALNLGDVWTAIRSADPVLLLIAAAWYFTGVAAISQRWAFLLRAVRPLTLRQLYSIVSIGYMGNNVYPLRTGEVLRLLLLQRSYRVPMARAAVTVVVERMFDGLVMLTFVVVALAVLNINSPTVEMITAVARYAAPLFLVALVLFFALASRPNLLRRLAEIVTRVLPAKLREIALHIAHELIAGLEGLRSGRDLFGAVVFSYLSWMLEAVVYWLVMRAFNLPTDYTVALLVVGAVNLAGIVPALPGGFGVFETAASAVLVLVGVEYSTAWAYAVTVHLVIWLPVTVVGYIFLVRQGLGRNALTLARAQALEITEEPPAPAPTRAAARTGEVVATERVAERVTERAVAN